MAVSTRVIKRRLKSIRSTRKITKAMELVAAAKMRKAVSAATGGRTYATLSRELLARLSLIAPQKKHALLRVRPVKRILLVVVTSNRGLAGGLNTNIIKAALAQIKNPGQLARSRVGDKWLPPKAHEAPAIDLISVGKKGERALSRLGNKIIASFHTLSDTPSIIDAHPIARLLIDEYASRRYDKVAVCYTDFISAINQKPKLRQLLPISTHDLDKMLDDGSMPETKILTNNYLFEPNPDVVLNMILDRLVEVQMYQALLEAAASEHSARMVAMRNATDAAGDMIDDLSFTFNQARQASITREIAEISAGASAL